MLSSLGLTSVSGFLRSSGGWWQHGACSTQGHMTDPAGSADRCSRLLPSSCLAAHSSSSTSLAGALLELYYEFANSCHRCKSARMAEDG